MSTSTGISTCMGMGVSRCIRFSKGIANSTGTRSTSMGMNTTRS